MKRFFLPLLLIVGLASCGGVIKKQKHRKLQLQPKQKAPKSMVTDEHASNPVMLRGANLLQNTNVWPAIKWMKN